MMLLAGETFEKSNPNLTTGDSHGCRPRWGLTQDKGEDYIPR